MMPVSSSSAVECATEVVSAGDVAVVQVRAQRLAAQAGLSRRAQIEFAIAASEAATNVVAHAGRGTVVLRAVVGSHVELEAIDLGPGIHAPSQRRGLGLGLGAIERLADAFDLQSSPRGTTVRARKNVRGRGR
jgi:anti-sigma regulatory factor (Ser/Thr protein kinase)